MELAAKCHPSRPHLAKGLCERCYQKGRLLNMPPALCHPEKRAFAKDKCHACYVRDWTNAKPERRKNNAAWRRTWKKSKDPRYERGVQLMHLYGITLELYDQMFAAQNGLCAICEKPEIQTYKGRLKPLAVDHKHPKYMTRRHCDPALVRGLLCSTCNWRLGVVEDMDWVTKAIAYLDKYEETKANV